MSEDYLDDVLSANKTHLARLDVVRNKIVEHREELTMVSQAILNVLSYYNIDSKQEDLVNNYNKAAADLSNTLEELGESLIDIGDDVTKIFEIEVDILKEQRELLNKMSEKAIEEMFGESK